MQWIAEEYCKPPIGIGRHLLLARRVRTDLLQVVSRQQVSLAAAIAHENITSSKSGSAS